jgi:hypothetical protein
MANVKNALSLRPSGQFWKVMYHGKQSNCVSKRSAIYPYIA